MDKYPQSLLQLDELDRLLLSLLQENSRVSNAELARQLHLTAPGLQKRLKKLELHGFIDRYVALLNRQAVGLNVLCFAYVSLAHNHPGCVSDFCDRMKQVPEVMECHHLTGRFEYLLKIVVPNYDRLEQLLRNYITSIPGVDQVTTNIVLNEVKTSMVLPLSTPSSCSI